MWASDLRPTRPCQRTVRVPAASRTRATFAITAPLAVSTRASTVAARASVNVARIAGPCGRTRKRRGATPRPPSVRLSEKTRSAVDERPRSSVAVTASRHAPSGSGAPSGVEPLQAKRYVPGPLVVSSSTRSSRPGPISFAVTREGRTSL